jgi:tetratricopeptide (TPR) repeat protein
MELFDYAISEFELASSTPSMKFDCYIMLGNCYMEKGDYNKSIDYYKMSSEIQGLSNEKLARLHFNLGLAYEANGMVSEAVETFNLVLKLDHSFAEAKERIKKLQP